MAGLKSSFMPAHSRFLVVRWMLAYHGQPGLLFEQLNQSHPAGGILHDDVRRLPLAGQQLYPLLHFYDGPMSALDMQQVQLLRIDAHHGMAV
jgi:hypothetical protein